VRLQFLSHALWISLPAIYNNKIVVFLKMGNTNLKTFDLNPDNFQGK